MSHFPGVLGFYYAFERAGQNHERKEIPFGIQVFAVLIWAVCFLSIMVYTHVTGTIDLTGILAFLLCCLGLIPVCIIGEIDPILSFCISILTIKYIFF